MGLGEELYKKNKLVDSADFFQDVRNIVTAIKAIDSNLSVFLYGSVGSGSATSYSDLDIAVITQDLGKKQLFTKTFYEQKRVTSCSVDLVVLTQDQFENDVDHPIAQVIKHEGIQLYPEWKWING